MLKSVVAELRDLLTLAWKTSRWLCARRPIRQLASLLDALHRHETIGGVAGVAVVLIRRMWIRLARAEVDDADRVAVNAFVQGRRHQRNVALKQSRMHARSFRIGSVLNKLEC
jgi:hypothetical protein